MRITPSFVFAPYKVFRTCLVRSRQVILQLGERSNYTAYQLTIPVLPLAIPVAARSKPWVCGRSLAEIAGSNPAGDTDSCPFLVLCVVG